VAQDDVTQIDVEEQALIHRPDSVDVLVDSSTATSPSDLNFSLLEADPRTVRDSFEPLAVRWEGEAEGGEGASIAREIDRLVSAKQDEEEVSVAEVGRITVRSLGWSAGAVALEQSSASEVDASDPSRSPSLIHRLESFFASLPPFSFSWRPDRGGPLSISSDSVTVLPVTSGQSWTSASTESSAAAAAMDVPSSDSSDKALTAGVSERPSASTRHQDGSDDFQDVQDDNLPHKNDQLVRSTTPVSSTYASEPSSSVFGGSPRSLAWSHGFIALPSQEIDEGVSGSVEDRLDSFFASLASTAPMTAAHPEFDHTSDVDIPLAPLVIESQAPIPIETKESIASVNVVTLDDIEVPTVEVLEQGVVWEGSQVLVDSTVDYERTSLPSPYAEAEVSPTLESAATVIELVPEVDEPINLTASYPDDIDESPEILFDTIEDATVDSGSGDGLDALISSEYDRVEGADTDVFSEASLDSPLLLEATGISHQAESTSPFTLEEVSALQVVVVRLTFCACFTLTFTRPSKSGTVEYAPIDLNSTTYPDRETATPAIIVLVTALLLGGGVIPPPEPFPAAVASLLLLRCSAHPH